MYPKVWQFEKPFTKNKNFNFLNIEEEYRYIYKNK